ncbi:MAG: cupin domain-containing protein [Betaproteobacteria bacterium]|nr:MAG: cupin domain-containing protein [Betaproteobacteria bacterium]
MKANFDQLIATLPRAPSEAWPAGVPFVDALSHGTMSVEVFAPNELDRQSPHAQDELYFIGRGSGTLTIDGVAHDCKAGDALFVRAGRAHRFTNFSKDFATWVVFWGPKGGEK